MDTLELLKNVIASKIENEEDQTVTEKIEAVQLNKIFITESGQELLKG